MKQRFIFPLFLLLLAVSSAFAQHIETAAHNVPLNKILIGLRDKYKLQFSFNDQLLSQYNLTISRSCTSPEEALQSLIKGLPLIYRKQGDIFLILPEGKKVSPRDFLLFGQIVEAKSNEPLPFTNILLSGD